MQVTEGVDIENIREARREEQVLNERGKHMPWVAVEEGGEEIDTYSQTIILYCTSSVGYTLTERRHQRSHQNSVRAAQ